MTSEKEHNKRKRSVDISETTLAVSLIVPAFILIGLVVVYPIGNLIYLSFHTSRLTEPWLGTPFVGVENFIKAVGDGRFWADLAHTLIFVGITVPGALVVGLFLALLANVESKAKWIVRLALLLPWAMPRVFAGLIFHWFFQYDYGIVNNVIAAFGGGKILWLSSTDLAYIAICLAIIWKTSSFMALIILAGLQTIPAEYYEAAKLDGAGKIHSFIEITLPMLRPAIIVALIFRTITALQTFDVPYAMTNGGPGHVTETLALLIYHTTLNYLNLGYGAALALLLFLISFVVTATYLRYVRQEQ